MHQANKKIRETRRDAKTIVTNEIIPHHGVQQKSFVAFLQLWQHKVVERAGLFHE